MTLLTDFGTEDGYVAAMKGVLSRNVPHVLLDDVSHEIPPGDVRKASWTLTRYWHLFPAGTIHLVVVDPGVGTTRKALGVAAGDRFFVAPDNGVLTKVLAAADVWRAVEISPADADDVTAPGPAEVTSTTFHGRDVFAPAVARLALGASLEELGAAVGSPRLLDEPEPVVEDSGGRVHGEVVNVDHFGNLITNITGENVSPGARIRAGGEEVSLHPTYGSVGVGDLLAVIGSSGLLEIAVRDGSAARALEGGLGLVVEIVAPEVVPPED